MRTEPPYHDSLLAEAYAKAYAEGFAEGYASSVLLVLEKRGIEVSERERERVLGCTDTARLDVWLDRSSTVQATAEIFGREDE